MIPEHVILPAAASSIVSLIQRRLAPQTVSKHINQVHWLLRLVGIASGQIACNFFEAGYR
jgi:hypothetical protein